MAASANSRAASVSRSLPFRIGTASPLSASLTVEGATGINRAILRPDLFGAYATGDVDEIDAARAQEYALLAALLARAPDAALLKRLSELRGDATPLGVAHVALAEAASKANVEQIEREYFDLFIGIGRGELMPYGSYYLTGFLHEKPLARLRAELATLGIERAEGEVEPEDHAAILCEIMSGLASRRLGTHPGADEKIFEITWRRGSGASSTISNGPTRRTSIAPSARSDACSSTLRRRRSRCLLKSSGRRRTPGGNGNENRKQSEGRTP